MFEDMFEDHSDAVRFLIITVFLCIILIAELVFIKYQEINDIFKDPKEYNVTINNETTRQNLYRGATSSDHTYYDMDKQRVYTIEDNMITIFKNGEYAGESTEFSIIIVDEGDNL